MLKRFFFLSFAFLIGLWILILNNFVIPNPSDYEKFQKMIKPVVKIYNNSNVYTGKAQQERKGIQKDIWYSDGKKRSHLQVKSEHSRLDLAQSRQKVHIIEYFQPVFCTITQGEEIRHLFAEKGTYEFPAHRLWADQVQMTFHKSYERDIPYFYGNADNISFFMSQLELSFQAKYFKAHIDLERLPH